MRIVPPIIAALSFALSISAAARAETMTRADSFGDWSLLTDSKSPHLFCFVTSQPKGSTPKDASRQAGRAYISAWPKDGIKGEVSFLMGFKIKKGADGTATVSPGDYKLFGSNDRAFVANSTQELKLVEAMRKGSSLTVAMTSDHGTVFTDTYSLNGVELALQKLQETCF